jgi:hypothetical protein
MRIIRRCSIDSVAAFAGCRLTCLLLMVALPGVAQQAGAKKASAPPAKAHSLSVDGVLAMVQAELSDDVVIARLRKQDKAFDLEPDDMIRLKKAKVSDPVLKVMLDPKVDLTAPLAPTPLYQPAVFPGFAANRASGATPSLGTVSGDLNDPTTAHDSGIYLYTKDREGKPQMVVLERASYQGAKSGGMFATAITHGIVKAKTRAMIPGAHANFRVSDSSPVFYFYFDDKQAGLGKTYFGVGSLSNPNQFVLLKLEIKKSDRETVIGKYSEWGSSSGSDAGATVPFKSERIRNGLYKVTIDALQPGEYCFFASSGGTTAAGPIAVTTTAGSDIFDFGFGAQ